MLKQHMQITNSVVLSQQMKKTLTIVERPVLELSALLTEVVEHNPLLEFREKRGEQCPDSSEKILPLDFEKRTIEDYAPCDFLIENEEKRALKEVAAPLSFYQYLIEQAREVFQEERDFKIAENIIGNLDERGFFTLDISSFAKELCEDEVVVKRVLAGVQTFEPLGVGAGSLTEGLLMQLRQTGSALSYKIVQNHFDELLKGKIELIAQKLLCSKERVVQSVKKEILSLSFNPRGKIELNKTMPVIVDLFIEKRGRFWEIELNEKRLPHIIKVDRYASEKIFLRSYQKEAFWLFKGLEMRRKNLMEMAYFLIERQKNFFAGKGEVKPLSLKELADRLGVHPSTASRIVANKYISTPKGIFPLSFFFLENAFKNNDSVVSKKVLLDTLRQEIQKEKCLSDRALMLKLAAKGFKCSRRTVAKYRQKLMIASSFKRKCALTFEA